jgi:DNA uptake protein ComE-like DNA-binding protein
MSRLSPAIVLVKNIHCSVPRTDFADTLIETGAQLILQLEGVITPLILRREGIEHYHVVAGHLEYYAALKAREINLSRGETINAFIIDPDNEATIIQQIDLFKKTHTMAKKTPQTNDINPTTPDLLDKQLQNLSQIAQSMAELATTFAIEIRELRTKLTSTTPAATETLVPTAKEEQPIAETPTQSASKPTKKNSAKKPPVKKSASAKKTASASEKSDKIQLVESVKVASTANVEWLVQLNALSEKDLISKLTRIKIKGDVIDAILKARPFSTVAEVEEIKGLGAKTVEKIEKAIR